MTNKSYAINMSLVRIGVLAAQIAVSPSAAAQWRDLLIDEGDRLAALARDLPHVRNADILCMYREADKGLAASKLIH
jgi:hypothetical protein